VVPSDPVVAPAGGSSGTSWPVVVYDSTFVVEVLGSTTPVLVEYWATWCGYCKEMSPLIDQVASEYSGRMKVAKLDINANPSMTEFYGIEAVPTFHIFSNGSIIASQVGSMSGDELRAWINESLG
jgi:thioredoxin 1